MFELEAVPQIIESMRQWFTSLRTASRLQDEGQMRRHREALEAILTALNETRIYLGSREQQGASVERDEAREAELSRLWTRCAIVLQPLNGSLAERCLMKGDYWANPARWTGSDLQRTNIGIDQILEDVRQLIRGQQAR